MSATIGTLLYTFLKGKKVGEDAFGNRYYTEKKASKGRVAKRWVVYNGMAEPSKIPALYHGWLHYTFDAFPDADREGYAWELPHQPNLTGTKGAYFQPGHLRVGGDRAAAAGDYEAWKPGDVA